MTKIFNLVLFLGIISILLIICNLSNNKDTNENNISNNDDYTIELMKHSESYPKSVPTIIFNYENGNYDTVPENTKKFNLQEKYNKDQKYGAQMVPKYEPPKGEENKDFYKKEHSDQPIIYDNRMYEKPIHTDREIIQDIENKLPAKISDVYDSSIIDFKTLIPKMQGKNSTMISDGGFNSNAFNPDFMIYENEKPENGGIIPKLYDTVYGFDPLLETNSAKF
jgi:hypothetical protein